MASKRDSGAGVDATDVVGNRGNLVAVGPKNNWAAVRLHCDVRGDLDVTRVLHEELIARAGDRHVRTDGHATAINRNWASN